MSDAFCTDLSLEAGEPLAGTAVALTDRWLVLEHDGPWGPNGLDDSGLPEAVVAHLGALTKRHRRARVQLVRRASTEDGEAGPRLWLADTSESAPTLTTLALSSLEELMAVPLEAWLSGTSLAPGEPVSEPLYLVCVHGKRDRCCALKGLPVHRGLRERVGARALQTTHLGGHRFAATLLVLPQGVCYGRVPAEDVDALIAASEQGEIYDLTRVRGRVAYASEAQTADVQLRTSLGERRVAALRLGAITRHEDGSVAVQLIERASDRAHEVRVKRETLAPMPQSCGAAPKPASRLVVL